MEFRHIPTAATMYWITVALGCVETIQSGDMPTFLRRATWFKDNNHDRKGIQGKGWPSLSLRRSLRKSCRINIEATNFSQNRDLGWWKLRLGPDWACLGKMRAIRPNLALLMALITCQIRVRRYNTYRGLGRVKQPAQVTLPSQSRSTTQYAACCGSWDCLGLWFPGERGSLVKANSTGCSHLSSHLEKSKYPELLDSSKALIPSNLFVNLPHHKLVLEPCRRTGRARIKSNGIQGIVCRRRCLQVRLWKQQKEGAMTA